MCALSNRPRGRTGRPVLTVLTMTLLDERLGRLSEELIRNALRNWAFVLPGPNERELPSEIANALHWVAKASRPLSDLGDAAIGRAVLDSLKLKLDGTAAAAETVRRKRRMLVNALHYAVELGEFKENPVARIRWKNPKVAGEVGPRVVANPEQARALLTAVSYVGGYSRARGRRLVGLFACMYYGAFRPAEAVALTQADLKLPEHGWGAALLNRTRPSLGKQWTDSGETHDDRGLKNRPAEEVRLVPIPPQLVVILKQHLDTFGTAEDGRLFTNERGGEVGSSTECGRRRGFLRFRLPSLPRRSRAARMTSGTRRCRRGSTRVLTRPRWPSAPETVLRFC